MISRRSEYAVPNAETRHGSIGGNCQALPEECSEAENRKLLAQTIEGYEHNVSSEKKCASSNWKSDGGGNATMDNCGIASWTSKRVQQRSTLHDVTVKTRENPKGDGKPARAGGRCLVTMPSRWNRDRKSRGRVEPSWTCDRGGANWYPSQYPAPAGLRASVGWGDCHCGGGVRPGSARRPVWCKARAGSGPAAGPGAVEARWGSRLGRVRPGRGPGHSGGEEKQPTGQRAAVTSTDRRGHAPPTGRVEREPRGRAQWRRGGAADWVGFGPAAGPGAAEARRSRRRAGVQQ